MEDTLLVIGGSTASGKSALALRVAAAMGGVIVNADSQQLYRGLPILTASPGAADRAAAEHRLYGVVAPAEQTSVGLWLRLVEPVLRELRAARRPVIVTGGSGMYLKALLHGLPELPTVPVELRDELTSWAADRTTEAVHARLASVDPLMAERVRPSDRQRLLRALEVILATGRSLASFQGSIAQRLALPASVAGVALVPEAITVAERVERRLAHMLDLGVLDEVAALREREPELATLPIAKVHGLRSLLGVLDGELEPDEAVSAIEAETRQYAKRQRTWFRHQLPGLRPFERCGEDVGVAELLAASIQLG